MSMPRKTVTTTEMNTTAGFVNTNLTSIHNGAPMGWTVWKTKMIQSTANGDASMPMYQATRWYQRKTAMLLKLCVIAYCSVITHSFSKPQGVHKKSPERQRSCHSAPAFSKLESLAYIMPTGDDSVGCRNAAVSNSVSYSLGEGEWIAGHHWWWWGLPQLSRNRSVYIFISLQIRYLNLEINFTFNLVNHSHNWKQGV